MKRVNEAILTAYLDDELTQEERRRVDSQLAESADLQAALTQLRREKKRVDHCLDILAPPLPETSTGPVREQAFSENGLAPPDLMVWESPGLGAALLNTVRKALGSRRFYLQTGAVIGLIIIGVSLARLWTESPSEGDQASTPPAVVPIAPAPPILFTAFSGETGGTPGGVGLYTIQPDGSDVTFLKEIEVSEAGGPVLSPDGWKIAYLEQGDIYVMDRDGSKPTNITNSPDVAETFPAWSPDGRRLLFAGAEGLGIIDADGDNRIQLTDGGPAYHQVWSPDGRQIAFIAQPDGVADLYLIKADGGGPVNLTQNADREMYPTWSADGQRLAFLDELVLSVITVDGANLTPLLNDDPENSLLSITKLVWSPTGEQLAFIATPIKPEPGPYPTLGVIKSDGLELLALSEPDSPVVAFDWSPDGQRLVYVAGNGQGNSLYLINADGTGRTRLTGDAIQAVQSVSWGNP